MPRIRILFWLGQLLLLSAAGIVDASPVLRSSPQLNVILPRGVQRGTQQVLTFTGARLDDALEILLYDVGISVAKIEVVDANNLKVTVDVAADCRLGEHLAQVRTKSGISEFRSLFVGALPTVEEVEPNSEFQQPQRIELNQTVSGVVQNEDIDWYVVALQAGQRLNVEIEAIRLGTMFDPFVGIVDANRFEIVAADDSALLKQDSLVGLVAETAGDYYVYVRESSFGGNDASRYRLHVGTFPRPTVAVPAGGPADQEIDIRLLGDIGGEIARKLPAGAAGSTRPPLLIEDEQGISPSPLIFRTFPHPNVLEAEPNEDLAALTAVQALPAAFNGVIERSADRDGFKFTAKKDEVWEFEVYAKRIGSGLDPVLILHNAERNAVASNDDARGTDAYLRFQVPADGEYYLVVTDHLQRGQTDFAYRVEVDRPQPSLAVEIPRTVQYQQYRQTIFVPRGNRFATLLQANRNNFGGDIVLNDNPLPAGVTATWRPMPGNVNVMPIVFEATAEAELAGGLFPFTARAADEKVAVQGAFTNLADFVLGEPNNSLYVGARVDKLAIAVVDALPFKLELVPPTAPLVQNGTLNLRVIAHRDPGFEEPITVEFPFRSPGIGTTGSIRIEKGQTEGVYPINANGNAAPGTWPVYVIGSANVAGGAAWASSALVDMTVATPFVQFEINRVACEQGQTAKVLCKLNHLNTFEGEATAVILGTPPEVAVQPLKFTKDVSELVFDVVTNEKSPVGNHKTMFCQVTIPVGGQEAIGTAGRFEFQISAPIVTAAPVAAAPQAAAAPPAAPPERPLSRLEQLRAAKARDSGGGE